jgi:hypothetical protein
MRQSGWKRFVVLGATTVSAVLASGGAASGHLLGGVTIAGVSVPGVGVPDVQTIQPPNARYCDNFDPTVCLQPFPNDYFTKLDPSARTGRRVHFSMLAMPRNAIGKPIQPRAWNKSDGFSPGSLITVHIPGLDNLAAYDQTAPVPLNDLGSYADPNAPVVVIDANTGKRWPIWTEIDSGASSDADRNLIIRAAVNFTEGHRYIVALRDLKSANGNPIAAPAVFAAFRDHPCTSCDLKAPYPGGETDRAAHMESIFRTLGRAGIARRGLYLAWDFTVASTQNLTQRLLAIRNDAFGQLGEPARELSRLHIPAGSTPPKFVITSVTDFTPATNGNIARQVQGRFYVPCYLTTPGCQPGGTFFYKPGSDLPSQIPSNVFEGRFTCNIPRVALTAPGRPAFYGHGLFGDRGEVNQGQLEAMAEEHDFVFCATDEIGMACPDLPSTNPSDWPGMVQTWLSEGEKGVQPDLPNNCDVPNVVAAIGDLSHFESVPDRLQEGILAELYLGRLMGHPDGFASNPAFQSNGNPVIDTSSQVYYDGNSQGGIMGGAVTAVMVDGSRSTLGVSGMNYSLLLPRSTDFGTGAASEGPPDNISGTPSTNWLPSYAWLVYKAYPSEADRQLVFALMQMLWDRGEPDGYAEQMTDHPLPDTPKHSVLMQIAFGDHQVSDFAAAVEARTIGAHIHWPALDPQRDPTGGDEYFDLIPHIPSSSWDGSAITVWDAGAPNATCSLGVGAPPFTDTPPLDGCPAGTPPATWGANDPHEYPRNTPAARQQKSDFDSPDGTVDDVCGDLPCHSADWSGIP